ncbi:MAG: hypothetical protein WBM81_14015, partial [Sedimenticolaceae bacterium]
PTQPHSDKAGRIKISLISGRIGVCMVFLVVIGRVSHTLFAQQLFSQISWICQHCLGICASL